MISCTGAPPKKLSLSGLKAARNCCTFQAPADDVTETGASARGDGAELMEESAGTKETGVDPKEAGGAEEIGADARETSAGGAETAKVRVEKSNGSFASDVVTYACAARRTCVVLALRKYRLTALVRDTAPRARSHPAATNVSPSRLV